MEFLIFLALLLYGIYLFFTKIVVPSISESKNKTEINRHGHRCYVDGLDHSEREVVRLLSHGLSHTDYFIFNNLIIPADKSDSTQIDHIVVSRFGIFVIETKYCSGFIFANKNRDSWTLTYRGGTKYSLPNPLWQNYGHVAALKKAMPFIEDNFVNLVVFIGDCELKTEFIENVLFGNELVQTIKKYNQPVISEQRLLMAIGKLSYMCQVIDITPAEHVANIQKMISSQKLKQETMGTQ